MGIAVGILALGGSEPEIRLGVIYPPPIATYVLKKYHCNTRVNDFSETNYLRIRWTDFRNFFTEWKRFGCCWSIWTSYSISQGTLPWQPILWQNYLPLALIALSFRNGMGYGYLNVRINSVKDASILCKIFLNFGPVTPEKTGLICELFIRHGKKLAYFVEYLRIYWTNFRNLFTISL